MYYLVKGNRIQQYTEWILDGNVVQNQDGSFSTQDAQYKNRLPDAGALMDYFVEEFLTDNLADYFEEEFFNDN